MHRLTQYIDLKASDFLRQAQNYEWTYYYFGEKVMGIPPSNMGNDTFFGLGPIDNIPPTVEQVNAWRDEMSQLANDLRPLVLDSKPIILDDRILTNYSYIARLLMTASQDLEFIRPDESEQDVRRKTIRNCKIVSAVIAELRIFRNMFTDKADRAQSGGSYRYRDIHDRLSRSETPY